MCWDGIIPEMYCEVGEAVSRTLCTICYICPKEHAYTSPCRDMYQRLTTGVALGKKVGPRHGVFSMSPWSLEPFCKSCTCFTHCKVRDRSIRPGLAGSGTLSFWEKVMFLSPLPKGSGVCRGRDPDPKCCPPCWISFYSPCSSGNNSHLDNHGMTSWGCRENYMRCYVWIITVNKGLLILRTWLSHSGTAYHYSRNPCRTISSLWIIRDDHLPSANLLGEHLALFDTWGYRDVWSIQHSDLLDLSHLSLN